MEMHDISGQPPSVRDCDEAAEVLRKFIIKGLHSVPPELAIQLTNLLRIVNYCKERL